MKFKDRRKLTKILYGGYQAFLIAGVKISGQLPKDQKQIIHEFINSPEDFRIADKYNKGTDWNYTDDQGSRMLKMLNFGPYNRKLLTYEDYREVNFNELTKIIFELISNEEESGNKTPEFEAYLNSVDRALRPLSKEDHQFYLLAPPESKIALLHPYSLDFYLCCFCLDLKSKFLSVIQIDDS